MNVHVCSNPECGKEYRMQVPPRYCPVCMLEDSATLRQWSVVPIEKMQASLGKTAYEKAVNQAYEAAVANIRTIFTVDSVYLGEDGDLHVNLKTEENYLHSRSALKDVINV